MNRGHFLLFRFREIPVVVAEQSCGLNAVCAERESHGAILHVSVDESISVLSRRSRNKPTSTNLRGQSLYEMEDLEFGTVLLTQLVA